MTLRAAAACALSLALLAVPGSAQAALRIIALSGSADGQVSDPTAVELNAAGELVVGDAGNTRIQKLTTAGQHLRSFATPHDGSQYLPRLRVAVGTADDTWVGLEQSSEDNLRRYATDGTALGSFGSWMSPEPGARFGGVRAVATDGTGNVYIAVDGTGGGHRIAKFGPDGTFLKEWPVKDSRARAIAVKSIAASGTTVVALTGPSNGTEPEMIRFDQEGAELARWTSTATEARGYVEGLQSVQGIALDAAGNVYTAGQTGLVQKFTASGELADVYVANAWMTPYEPPPATYDPCAPAAPQQSGWMPPPTSPAFSDLAIDGAGDVYLSDTATSRILKLDGRPEAALRWGPRQTWGSGPQTGQVVTFDASRSKVAFGTAERFEWDLDGDGTFELDTGSNPTAARAYGTAGTRTVRVRVTGSRGGSAVATDSVAIGESQAQFWGPTVGLTGQTVKFDVSGNTLPCSTNTYKWDLDGDGVYETDTGTVGKASAVFQELGTTVIGVQITRGGVRTDRATLQHETRLAPPPGEMGVTINNGAQFTNDPTVVINPTWPKFTKRMTIANDGGFRGSRSFVVGPSQVWRLSSSGPERLPKTVYIRFDTAKDRTFTDDIILDETKPAVTDATILSGLLDAAASVARKRTVRLRIKARDNLSGVAKMQITATRGRPGRWRPMRTRARVSTGARKLWVRVRDKAGNASRWRLAR